MPFEALGASEGAVELYGLMVTVAHGARGFIEISRLANDTGVIHAMTIRIALLGTVMSARAVASLKKTLSKNGIGDAVRCAAIRHPKTASNSPVRPESSE